MSTKNLSLIVIAVLILFLGGCGCNSYNGLVTGDQTVQSSWSNVETNYQRRTDLYNSVVKTIQGSANFEKSTLQAVIDARSNATSIHVDVNDASSIAHPPRSCNKDRKGLACAGTPWKCPFEPQQTQMSASSVKMLNKSCATGCSPSVS